MPFHRLGHFHDTIRYGMAAAMFALTASSFAADRPAIHPKPFAMVSVASFDHLLEDAHVLLEYGKLHKYQAVLQGMISQANDLQGLDKTRPWGVMLFFDSSNIERDPVPLFFLPVADIEALRTTVTRFGVTLEKLDAANEFLLVIDQMQLPVHLEDGYALVIGPRQRDRQTLDTQPTHFIPKLSPDRDIQVVIRRDGIPERFLDEALQDFRSGRIEELRRAPGESDQDYKIRSAVQTLLFDTIERILLDVEQVSLEGTFDAQTGQLTVSLQVTTPVDSALHEQIDGSLPSRTRFADMVERPVSFSWLISFQLSQRVQDLALQFVHILSRETGQEIGSQLPAEDRADATRIFESLEATVARGQLDVLLQLAQHESGHIGLLLGIGIEKTEAADAALRAVLPHAESSPNIVDVTLDAVRHSEIDFHRIQPKHLRRRDTFLYGEDAVFHLGVGQQAIWLIAGKPDIVSRFGSLATDQKETAAPIRVDFRLRDWLKLAAQGKSSSRAAFVQRAEAVFADQQIGDHIGVRLAGNGQGLQLSVTIDDGYLRLLAQTIAEQIERE